MADKDRKLAPGGKERREVKFEKLHGAIDYMDKKVGKDHPVPCIVKTCAKSNYSEKIKNGEEEALSPISNDLALLARACGMKSEEITAVDITKAITIVEAFVMSISKFSPERKNSIVNILTELREIAQEDFGAKVFINSPKKP